MSSSICYVLVSNATNIFYMLLISYPSLYITSTTPPSELVTLHHVGINRHQLLFPIRQIESTSTSLSAEARITEFLPGIDGLPPPPLFSMTENVHGNSWKRYIACTSGHLTCQTNLDSCLHIYHTSTLTVCGSRLGLPVSRPHIFFNHRKLPPRNNKQLRSARRWFADIYLVGKRRVQDYFYVLATNRNSKYSTGMIYNCR